MMTPAERRLWDTHRGYSQRDRTVRYLARAGEWCSIHAIHRAVGFCRLNSRVAEARKVFKRDGHPFDIVHSIRDGEHGYELVPLAGGGEARAQVVTKDASGDHFLTPPASGSNLGLSSGSPDTPQPLDGPLNFDRAQMAFADYLDERWPR